MVSNFKFAKFKRAVENAIQQMKDGEVQLVAASLSFSTAIALVPFIAVVLATFQTIGGLESLYPKVEMFLLRNLREAAGSDVTKFIRIFLRNISGGKMGATGAVFLFLTSLRLLHDMEVGIHRVWNHQNKRHFFRRLIYHWALILVIPLFLAVYLGITSSEKYKIVKAFFPLSVSNSMVLVGCLYFIYKYVPNLYVRPRVALISSILSASLLFAVHKSFALLAVKFFNYNKIYGSFAALPILLFWILAIWYVILGGVALCASLQKQHVA